MEARRLMGEVKGGRALLLAVAFFFFCFTMTGDGLVRAEDSYSGAEASWLVNMKLFSRSAHGALSCEACHGLMDDKPGGHPILGSKMSLRKGPTERYDYSRCKICHKESYAQYIKGIHAEALKKEKTDPKLLNLSVEKRAPTCGHCHSSHYDEGGVSRLDAGRRMTEVCGGCHQDQMVTYLNGFHGKTAVNLGDTSSAYCSDCHGAHACVSLKPPEAALPACLRCHPKADLSFAKFVNHPTAPDGKEKVDKEKAIRVAVIRIVTVVMSVIVLLVVVFFYGHSFLWILRELHEKLRRH